MEVLTEILAKGETPIIVAKDTPQSGSHLGLTDVSNSLDLEYVAISHAWSDGRGNPSQNTLPLYQLDYLVSKAREVLPNGGPIAIWIDTLCIPIRPNNARKQVVVNIRSVYVKAWAIIVMDKGLEDSDDTS
ncbi:hypothetical protein BCR34DRAFT_608532 [Clohesyomyces aquaticus]|uniref:Heterokaryon incompatibility domain-containing protein n=1 Tax=Clohesyomyces aquaticus TaxID=1231657 RepID=A0A1Y1Y6F3_9PLEO|nr:hypothetical protein BCR34DRAFT_608532 [Clohesyomyces aquaticus]